MLSVKQYIKNPKFGQGDEPEFLPVGTTGIDTVKNRLLQVERQALNITIRDKKNYASLTEAIAAVTDDKYKFKGFILTFYTGTEWVSKRYNGEDASGFADEGNWINVGDAADGIQYLDLSIFPEDSGTLSEEDYQKVVKAYENGMTIGLYSQMHASIKITNSENTYIIYWFSLIPESKTIAEFIFSIKNNKTYTRDYNVINLINKGNGSRVLSDNEDYVEFVKPIKIELDTNHGGTLTKELHPNIFYKLGDCSLLTITLYIKVLEPDILDEYMFEFISGPTPTTLADIPNIKWQNGEKLVPEANFTYQVSIVNNCAVYAKFPNA